MTELKTALKKRRQHTLLKASLLKPTNLLVLVVGCLAGNFSLALVPIGIAAYGALCFLDFSNKDFAKKVFTKAPGVSDLPADSSPLPQGFRFKSSQSLRVPELTSLQGDVVRIGRNISQLYNDADDMTRQLLGELSRIEELGMRSERFLKKAQGLRDYLDTEDFEQIEQGIATLQAKTETSQDPFAQQQYRQALMARTKHRQNIQDIQQAYERLVSQVTNISTSLESLYSRMIKINSAGCGSAQFESEDVSKELQNMLQEMEYLESALNEQLSPAD